MTYISIIDNGNKIFKADKPLRLNIIRDEGIVTESDYRLHISDLNAKLRPKGDVWKYSHFQYDGNGGMSFTVNIVIGKNETWNGYLILDVLNRFSRGVILKVASDGIGIVNDLYVISDVGKRKQTSDNYIICEYTFKRFEGITTYKYKNNLKNVKKTSISTGSTGLNKQLKKCKVANMKLKKKNTCCKYLNMKLYGLGFISKTKQKKMSKNGTYGTFTKTTTSALKKFQKKYKSKYKLKVNGKMDKATLKALYSTK